MRRTVANVSVLGQRGEWAARPIEVINAAQVDVVWVGMTELKHKKWVDKIFHRVMATFAAFIDAVFDFYTMKYPRAPQWMCALGMARQNGDASMNRHLIGIRYPLPVFVYAQYSARLIAISNSLLPVKISIRSIRKKSK
jgi:UDP-N-acetyl-D-mannosaminuronic acid transferase (WecB/TagA/CpsF family)